MTPEPDLETRMTEALQAAGVRVTSQRMILLRLLAEARDHPGAAELHRRARGADGRLSLATVYRTLAVLERAGVVQRHSFDGVSARFEPAEEPHHDHIVDRVQVLAESLLSADERRLPPFVASSFARCHT